MQDIEISCWYGDFNSDAEVVLHGFSDASASSYGCCIYILYCYNNYSYTTSLVSHNLELHQLKHKLFPL